MDQALQTLTARREFMRAEFSGDAGPAGSQDRTGHQPANRKGARSDHTAPTAWSRRRGDRMKRREFITLLGGAAVAWPLAARAQQSGKVYRLGVLADVTPALSGLFYGLRDLGYVEGQNLIIERRSSEGRAERWSELASELVGLRVDAIVVSTTPAALAAKKATGTIQSSSRPLSTWWESALPKVCRGPVDITGFALLIP